MKNKLSRHVTTCSFLRSCWFMTTPTRRLQSVRAVVLMLCTSSLSISKVRRQRTTSTPSSAHRLLDDDSIGSSFSNSATCHEYGCDTHPPCFSCRGLCKHTTVNRHVVRQSVTVTTLSTVHTYCICKSCGRRASTSARMKSALVRPTASLNEQ
jgi:hypothetical protein